MTQKTKAIILVILIALATILLGIYLFQKNKMVAPTLQTTALPQNTNQQPTTQAQIEEKKENIVTGKLRSINATQVYIELADGKGSAININSTTPVRTEGDEQLSNLSILKSESMVSIKVDEKNNAVEILIKK
ncbi:MAG: hypothetical protein US70_C0031G0002 [Parcubacteria group bacterium GW2011_GWD2_38_11]|nr:MAG: hypothetical protein US70_C0031G0002 [Parcubacteria group bacterium GW2011_GWD2_38_11]